MSRITHLPRNHSWLSRVIAPAAIALSLALPAGAAGYADPGTGGYTTAVAGADPTADLTPFPPGEHQATLNHQGRGAPSSQFVAQSAPQPIVSAQPTDNGAGFDLGDAAVGAAVALGLVALCGAGLAMRRHVRSAPEPIS